MAQSKQHNRSGAVLRGGAACVLRPWLRCGNQWCGCTAVRLVHFGDTRLGCAGGWGRVGLFHKRYNLEGAWLMPLEA